MFEGSPSSAPLGREDLAIKRFGGKSLVPERIIQRIPSHTPLFVNCRRLNTSAPRLPQRGAEGSVWNRQRHGFHAFHSHDLRLARTTTNSGLGSSPQRTAGSGPKRGTRGHLFLHLDLEPNGIDPRQDDDKSHGPAWKDSREPDQQVKPPRPDRSRHDVACAGVVRPVRRVDQGAQEPPATSRSHGSETNRATRPSNAFNFTEAA